MCVNLSERSARTNESADQTATPENSYVDLKNLLASPPGWYVEPPSVSRAIRQPLSCGGPMKQAEDLAEFDGETLTAPAISHGENGVVTISRSRRATRARRRNIALVSIISISAVSGGIYLFNTLPPIFPTSVAPEATVDVEARTVVVAPVRPTTTIAVDVPVPVTTPQAIDTTAVVQGAQRAIDSLNLGGSSGTSSSRGPGQKIADYVQAIAPETLRIDVPVVINGASIVHVSATSSAASVAARRSEDPEAAREAMTNAIDGSYPVEMWLNNVGAVVGLRIHILDSGNGGYIQLAFLDATGSLFDIPAPAAS